MQQRAKKSLGQHFLVDRGAILRIAHAIPESADVLEIGPGRGAITEALLSRVGHLTLIEKDDALAGMWQERAATEPRLRLVHGDVLKRLLPTANEHRPEWIAGNLPYNISGPLSAMLFSLQLAGGMVLMYQREVAERIAASPGGRQYGGLSVLARHHYEVKRLLVLPPGAFSPPPRVHSAVLLLTPHHRQRACSYTDLQRTVRRGFAHRRKTIANNFREMMSPDDWMELGIDAGTRPEQLDYGAWERLANRLGGGEMVA
jgi:16S rRNA (adenine1518-N6/adenine1519-N6)-dimethyltransferase